MGVVIVDGDEYYSRDDSLSLPITPASFGNILKQFPDFLFCVLPYIADRMIWNSIALSNRHTYEQSKAFQPPWPLCYKLLSGDSTNSHWSWSPCGTHIACVIHRRTDIAIYDQQYGPLRNHGNAHGRGNGIICMKYSPDGSYLVSIGSDTVIRLWDNNATVNYEQMQKWDMREEVVRPCIIFVDVCVSACSKYIAVATDTHVFLKEVEDGKTISRFAQTRGIDNIMFSSNGRAIFVCGKQYHRGIIKVWRPYLDDDDEDRVISLWKEADTISAHNTYKVSNDNTMVVIHNEGTNTGMLWSIEIDHKCLTKKFDFQGSIGHHFTPDGKYIVVNNKNGKPTFWSIAEGKFTKNPIQFLDTGSNGTKHNNLIVQSFVSFSPNNRQCIVQAAGSGNHYTRSYFLTE